MSSALDQSRAYWDAHARRDPLWAILSEPSRKDAQWDVDGFFQTGVAEIASLLYELDSRDIRYDRGSALDFGCGVGRLTQALAVHFARVVGIDVSPRMIELARQLNQHGERVSYIANDAANLQVIAGQRVDVLVTQVVLQHIDPDLAVRFFAEFFRVTTPGGLVVFQWPSHQRPLDQSRPAAPSVMPDSAYQMSIEVAGAPALAVAPGATVALDVDVTNRSPVDWARDAHGAISLGNHWTDAAGRLIQRDDGRTALPSLASGESCRLPLAITAPRAPGSYSCELDLAHEGVLWFSDRGAPPTRFTVQVGAPTGASAARPPSQAPAPEPAARPRRPLEGVSLAAADPGDFPMHGRSRAEVERLIAQQGGTLLHVEPDRSCGPDWVSYRYYARVRG